MHFTRQKTIFVYNYTKIIKNTLISCISAQFLLAFRCVTAFFYSTKKGKTIVLPLSTILLIALLYYWSLFHLYTAVPIMIA